MSQPRNITSAGATRAWLAALALLAPAATLHAQAVTSFDPKKVPQPEAATTETPDEAKPEETAHAVTNDTPSRYLGTDANAYISAMTTVFAIRGRSTDPFAQIQDPESKPAKPKIVRSSSPRPAAILATPFSDIVGQIRVTTVMPKENRFLVGTRSIKLGDQFPIVFSGKQYRAEVTEVSSQRIVFKNLENGETGTLALDVVPRGMSRGTGGVTAPGMQSSRPDAPLEIDSSSSPAPFSSARSNN